MDLQVLRPTYKSHAFCSLCGVKEGWYLRRETAVEDYPLGGVYAEYWDGVPHCPFHRCLLRTRPRGGSRRKFLIENGVIEAEAIKA